MLKNLARLSAIVLTLIYSREVLGQSTSLQFEENLSLYTKYHLLISPNELQRKSAEMLNFEKYQVLSSILSDGRKYYLVSVPYTDGRTLGYYAVIQYCASVYNYVFQASGFATLVSIERTQREFKAIDGKTAVALDDMCTADLRY